MVMPPEVFFMLRIALPALGLLCFRTHLRIAFVLCLKRKTLGFLLRLYWICRVLLVKWFLIHKHGSWVFCIIIIVFLVFFFQTISSVSYSFHCRGLSFLWLGLFSGILFYSVTIMAIIFPWFFFKNVCCICI